jgi:hypothetical protein
MSLKERFALWWKQFSCLHTMEVEHEDDACQVERCTHCGLTRTHGG